MEMNLTPERIELLREVLEPVAKTKGPRRQVAQGMLLSIGWAERKKAA
jgi:hypothetical protein